MNEKCEHRIGVSRSRFCCFTCGKYFEYSFVLLYLERRFGSEEGLEKWRELRNALEEIKRYGQDSGVEYITS